MVISFDSPVEKGGGFKFETSSFPTKDKKKQRETTVSFKMMKDRIKNNIKQALYPVIIVKVGSLSCKEKLTVH